MPASVSVVTTLKTTPEGRCGEQNHVKRPTVNVQTIASRLLRRTKMEETLNEKREKYQALLHAMQTGVAYDLESNTSSGSPKHLRVGINAAMSDHGALVKLLIDKGLITESEYYDYLIEFMEREVESYTKKLNLRYFGGGESGIFLR
jgi:hypothetical protein